jgi:Fungal trichothecene efflux pump (TRI12)
LGLFLLTGGTVTFLCGLSWGGDGRYGWKTAHAIAPTVLGTMILVIALPLYEVYGAKYPLVDRSLFRTRNFIILNVQTFVIGFVQFSTYVCKCIYTSKRETTYTKSVWQDLPQILIAFWEKDPLMLGVDRLPLGGGLLLALLFAGFVFQKTGKGKWAYSVYAFCILLGPALCKFRL